VVCTVALNATSQPEYARRHAIKICAYREFLEPLQDSTQERRRPQGEQGTDPQERT